MCVWLIRLAPRLDFLFPGPVMFRVLDPDFLRPLSL
jgi:hypothetical protein